MHPFFTQFYLQYILISRIFPLGCQNGSQSPSSSSDHDIGGGSSGGSPRKMTSSHYAQISPLRGQGLPPASAMGLRNSDQRSLMTHSPAKSYFEVCT